jgi:hypothetical protein
VAQFVGHQDNQFLDSVVKPVPFIFMLAVLVRLVVTGFLKGIDPANNEGAVSVVVGRARVGTSGDSGTFRRTDRTPAKVGHSHVKVFHSGGERVPDYFSHHLIRNCREVFQSHFFSFLIFSFTHSIVQTNYF